MLLQIDATFIFVFISFIIFIGLMKLICYKPLTKVMEEREKFYQKNEKTIIETNSKIKDAENELISEISKAKLEGSEMIKSANSANMTKKENEINSKKEENKKELTAYEQNLAQNSNEIKNELKQNIETYVKNLTSKILNQNIENIKIDNNKIDEILRWRLKNYT